MKTFSFEIIFPDAQAKRFEATSVTLMTKAGQITLLPGHADLITLTVKGNIRVKTDAGEQNLDTQGGMLYVGNGSARLLTLTSEK